MDNTSPHLKNNTSQAGTNFTLSDINSTTLVTVDSTSVRSIILFFSKTYWGLFLDWLYRNVLRVLIGSGILIIFIFLMIMFRKYTNGSEERLRVKMNAVAEKRVNVLRKQVRQSSLKSKFRKVLRRVYPFFAALVEMREEKVIKEEGVGMEKAVDNVTEFNDDVPQIQEMRPLADGPVLASYYAICTLILLLKQKFVNFWGVNSDIFRPRTMPSQSFPYPPTLSGASARS